MKTFGLIGYRLDYSFSRKYFTEKFERNNLNECQYLNFELDSISQLEDIFKQHDCVAGLNCTIPYKQKVMDLLDELDDDARAIGAVNTIKVDYKGSKPYLTGYNTDCIGFKESLLKKLRPIHDSALILGTGGAAAAVSYVLSQLGISYTFASRSPKEAGQIAYADITPEMMANNKLIINTTPLGTHPNVEQCPNLPYDAVGAEHYFYDLVYNPSETLFLQKAKGKGATIMSGQMMLELQAEAAWEIWNNIK